MRMVGFQTQEELDLKTILSGVLSLGNILFVAQDTGGVTVDGESCGWLKASAGQFGVQEEDLQDCLVYTISVMRGETIRRLHTQQQAEDARDSIARVVYSRMFGWIVTKVNELLAGDVKRGATVPEIGILDIFGFENFAVNRFEQLCINLANEQLQNFFNNHIFLMEQQHYLQEGIEQDAITFVNNQPILDLFLARPAGILSILDEQTSFPRASDDTFLEKLSIECKTNPHFERARGRDPGFIIHHYAGKVQYTAVGFLEKNRDTVPTNIQNLFISSVTGLLGLLFAASISRTGTLMPQKGKALILQESSSSRKMSVGAQFRRSLGILMEKMYSASPHFIRCIKPNNEKLPGIFHPEEVLRQLRYNGLMETLRIRRDGFSWRPTFQEFVERYGIFLLTPVVPVSKESCMCILQKVALRDWQCGSSRLFFKYWHQDELNQQQLRLQQAAAKIQKCYKGLRCHRVYQKLLEELKVQEKQKREEEERERKREQEREREREREQECERERARLQELEAQKSAMRPVPVPRKRLPPVRIKSEDTPMEPPVPRPRSTLVQLSPFDNAIHRIPSVKSEEGEKRQIQRRKTLMWFRETQAGKVLDDGEFPPWLYGMTSRRDTENLLTDKEVGDFLIRISQTRAGYILSYRGMDHCRHYMIDVRCNGCYVILGEDRAHSSLSALIEYHRIVGLQPYGETLREACEKTGNWGPDCEEIKLLTRTLSLGDENVPSSSADSASNQSEHKKLEVPAHPLPRFHKSIRRAMQEIQQASTAQKTLEV